MCTPSRGQPWKEVAARKQHSQVGPGPEGIWGASSCSPPAGLPASCEQSPLFPGPPGRGQLWGPAKVGGLEPHLCTGSWAVCTSLLTQWHHHQQHCPGPSCPATTGPCPKKRPARPWPQRQAAELSQSEGVPVSLRQWVEQEGKLVEHPPGAPQNSPQSYQKFRFHSPLQCSCLENPRHGGAWWAAVYGVAQSQTQRKRLSSSSSSTLLNEPLMKEEIKTEIKNYFELNINKDTVHPGLWNATRAVLKRKRAAVMPLLEKKNIKSKTSAFT